MLLHSLIVGNMLRGPFFPKPGRFRQRLMLQPIALVCTKVTVVSTQFKSENVGEL